MKLNKPIVIAAILTPVLIYFFGPYLLTACGLSVPVIAAIICFGTLCTLFVAIFAYVRYNNEET